MTNNTTSNGLRVGDHVIDFRGQQTGVVRYIETNRGPGKSDKVGVEDSDGDTHWNYCDVWSRVQSPATREVCENRWPSGKGN